MTPQRLSRVSWIFKGMDVANTKPVMLGDAYIYNMPYKAAIESEETELLDLLDEGSLPAYRTLINKYAQSHSILGPAVLYWKSRFRPQMCTWQQVHNFSWECTDRDAFYIVSPTKEVDIATLEPFVEDFKWKEV